MEKEEQLVPGDIVTVIQSVEGLLSRYMDNPEYWLETGEHAMLITDPRKPLAPGSTMLLDFVTPASNLRRRVLVDLAALKKVPEREITPLERAERQYVREEGLISMAALARRTFICPELYERGTNEWKKVIGKYQKSSGKKRRRR